MYDLGSRLKSIRLKRGLTQKALAARVNKSVSAISSYESNAQLPPIDVLVSIAQALQISIDSLVGLNNYSTYSAKGLSSSQQDLIDMLFFEFNHHEKATDCLTQQQLIILQKLILEFSKIN